MLFSLGFFQLTKYLEFFIFFPSAAEKTLIFRDARRKCKKISKDLGAVFF